MCWNFESISISEDWRIGDYSRGERSHYSMISSYLLTEIHFCFSPKSEATVGIQIVVKIKRFPLNSKGDANNVYMTDLFWSFDYGGIMEKRILFTAAVATMDKVIIGIFTGKISKIKSLNFWRVQHWFLRFGFSFKKT